MQDYLIALVGMAAVAVLILLTVAAMVIRRPKDAEGTREVSVLEIALLSICPAVSATSATAAVLARVML